MFCSIVVWSRKLNVCFLIRLSVAVCSLCCVSDLWLICLFHGDQLQQGRWLQPTFITLYSSQFHEEIGECSTWLTDQTSVLNSEFNKSNINLDEGEVLIKRMQEMRNTLAHYEQVWNSLLSDVGCYIQFNSSVWQNLTSNPHLEVKSKPKPLRSLGDFKSAKLLHK